jgi:hypothetical protein
MSIRSSARSRIEVYRYPEFLEAYHTYILTRGLRKDYADKVVEIFKTLNVNALPIKLDTLEAIRLFEENTLRDLDSAYTSQYFDPKFNSPEAIAEYKRIYRLFGYKDA